MMALKLLRMKEMANKKNLITAERMKDIELLEKEKFKYYMKKNSERDKLTQEVKDSIREEMD